MNMHKNVSEQVIEKKDVIFGQVQNHSGVNEELKLDIYYPYTDSDELRPVILWIHGGGYRPGNDKEQGYIVNFSNRFAKKGFVCIANDYRLRENPLDDLKGTIEDALHDTILALDWIRANHGQYKIDKNRILIAGGSAGGIIACYLCYGDYASLQGIKGSIILWGTPPSDHPLKISKESIPAIVIHGTGDELVSFKNSEELVRNLKINEVYHKFLPLEGAPHTPLMYVDQMENEISDFINSVLLLG